MAPSDILLCISVVLGFISVHCADKSTEQTGIYFVEQPDNVFTVKGGSALLPCSARSTKRSELKLMWIHDGAPVISDERRQILSNGSLYITRILHRKIGYSDVGEYNCVVSDGHGYLSSRLIRLDLAVPPNFTVHPMTHHVMEGSNLRMECHVESIPSAVVTWERDDYPLPAESQHHVTLPGHGFNGSTMYIFNVGFEDVGKYRCVATNPATQVQKQSRRAVLTVRPKERRSPPRFLAYHFRTKYVHEGGNVPLDCVVDDSAPNLVWTYRRWTTVSPEPIFNVSTNGRSILYLKNVTYEQTGLYACSLEDTPEKEIVIGVKVLTRPQFVETPETVVYQAARAVRFRCKAVGHPTPKVFWVKDGLRINITGRISLSSKVNVSAEMRISELLVASSLASDAGIYQCVAANPVGMIWSAARLILNSTRPAPKPPEKVTCQTISSTEIRVDWEVDSEKLIALTIHYHDLEGGEELRDAVQPTNRSIVVRSLAPYTNYTFYLRSYSKIASDFSNQAICQTEEEVPEAAPEMKLLSSTPHSLHIAWTPLAKKKARGKILEYKIQWRLLGAPSTNVFRISGDILNYTITGLSPGSEYEVQVLAETSKGGPIQEFPWKTFTLPEANSTESLLAPPEVALQPVSPSSIKVTWTTPNEDHPDLQGYKLFFRIQNGGITSGPIVVPSNVSEFYLTQLVPDTVYEVTVLSFSNEVDGNGGSSTARTLPKDDTDDKKRPPPKPGPPTGVEAKPLSGGVISLSWQPPTTGLSNLKDYTICYRPVTSWLAAFKKPTKCISSEQRKVLIQDLEPYTLYEFKVRSNGIGAFSEDSQSVECYTSEDVPGQVQDIKWKAENRTTIYATWRKPWKPNGIIRNYTVSYTRDSSLPLKSWSTLVLPGDTYKAHLTDLTPNTEYSMIVRASTSAGLGPYGNPKKFIISVPVGAPSKKTPKTEKDRRNEQYVGIVVGLGIGLTCIVICTICIICRRRCIKNQANEEIEPTSGRGTNASASQAEREMRVDAQETEFFPCLSADSGRTTAPVEPSSDNKGRHPNGFQNGMRISLVNDGKSTKSTPYKGNIHITENPRFDTSSMVSPLLGQQPLSSTLSSDNELSRDLSIDSDAPNHSKVPLLTGKRKFSEADMSKLDCEDSESEREGKFNLVSNFTSALEPLNNVNNCISQQEIIPLTEENKQREERSTSNHCLKENTVLENPDFRFSDSCADKAPKRKNGYLLPQKLLNGAADPLLQNHYEFESTGLHGKKQSLIRSASNEVEEDG